MKFAAFLLLTVGAFALFALTMTFAPLLPAWGNYAAHGGFIVVSGLLWLLLRGKRLRPVFFAFFAASVGLTLGFYGSDPILALLGLTTKTPMGVAAAKLVQAALIVIGILAVALLSGESLGSLYLRKGRLLIGLAVGLAGAAVCVFLAMQQPAVAAIGLTKLKPLLPWIALFVFANACMEELLFRGLFLGRYEPLMGKAFAVLATALAFTLAHMQVTYAPEMIPFLSVTFVFALLWAWLMQATKSLWGSVLFHAGADVIIILPVFKSLGAI